MKPKIIALSDTHGQHEDVEECDILIFAGDWSHISGMKSTLIFNAWLDRQPAKYKVVIPGNHDQEVHLIDTAIVLINDGIEVEGITIFGSPYTPEFCNWHYMKSPEDMEKMYKKFPTEGIDILITHGPPKGILDNFKGERIGCPSLYDYVKKLQPKAHIFGHNHHKGYCSDGLTDYYNVTVLDQDYYRMFEPTEIIL